MGECPILPSAALTVTPHDTNTFACPVSIFVGVAGTVVCTPSAGGADVTFTMPAGSVVPVRVSAVKTTSTATGMVALY